MSSSETANLSDAGSGLSLVKARKWWLGIDRNQQVLTWAQSTTGIVVIHASFLVLLATPIIRTSHAALIAVTLLLCGLFPNRRMLVLGAMGGLFFLLRPYQSQFVYDKFGESWNATLGGLPLQIGLTGIALTFLALLTLFLRGQRLGSLGVLGNRPILSMFALVVGLTTFTMWAPSDHVLVAPAWALLACICSTFFLVAYIMLDNRSKNALPVTQAVGFVRPVWAAGMVPIKSPNFLRKFEASNDHELAVTRLKALKLLVWATILYWIWSVCFDQFLYGGLEIPSLNQSINALASHAAPQGVVMRWSVLGAHFISELILFAVEIHIFVAVVRMAGFRIPLGFVNPLASRTLSEYWGRYFFYFKEMLADLFFFPAFQRYFKSHYRLRIAFATFAAAFVGNILFDLIPRLPEMGTHGFWAVIADFYSYAIYAGVLTVGLIISQIRPNTITEEQGWMAYHVLPRVKVIGFFMLLEVFDDSLGAAPLELRISYFSGLFGLN